MDADLMGPAGLEPGLDECEAREALEDAKARDGPSSLALGADGHALAVNRVAADGRLDPSLIGCDTSVDHCQILARDRALGELSDKRVVGGWRLRYHEQPRGTL